MRMGGLGIAGAGLGEGPGLKGRDRDTAGSTLGPSPRVLFAPRYGSQVP